MNIKIPRPSNFQVARSINTWRSGAGIVPIQTFDFPQTEHRAVAFLGHCIGIPPSCVNIPPVPGEDNLDGCGHGTKWEWIGPIALDPCKWKEKEIKPPDCPVNQVWVGYPTCYCACSLHPRDCLFGTKLDMRKCECITCCVIDIRLRINEQKNGICCEVDTFCDEIEGWLYWDYDGDRSIKTKFELDKDEYNYAYHTEGIFRVRLELTDHCGTRYREAFLVLLPTQCNDITCPEGFYCKTTSQGRVCVCHRHLVCPDTFVPVKTMQGGVCTCNKDLIAK